MVLESTIICVDNSDYMRNGDFIPTRLQAQQDAVGVVCHSKTRSNPENNVGVITLSGLNVLTTLTSDVGRILGKLHEVQPSGSIRLISGIRIAHLALKHRQGKNHRTRIVVFIGSPVEEDEKDLVKLAKRLKKEKVNVDIVNFGEQNTNTEKLTSFINTINGRDGTSSHLVTVPPGPMLSDALVSSPIVVGEDGSGSVPAGMGGFEFGVDPAEDPELALALRVSMEEQRSRQEDEARKAAVASAAESADTAATTEDTNEENLLKQALEMSLQQDSTDTPAASSTGGTSSNAAAPAAASTVPDFASMNEEEQIAYAMQMSLSNVGSEMETEDSVTPMETDDGDKTPTASASDSKKTTKDEDEYSEVMNDPSFIQSVLEGLPGVDTDSEAVRSAMGSLTQQDKEKKADKKDEEKK